jgi:Ca2+-binding RTX toxin-like protein
MNLINTKWWITIAVLTPLSGIFVSPAWGSPTQCIKETPCYGTAYDDIITGTVFIHEIFAASGNDIVYAYGGRDHINGDEGNDFLHAGLGPDVINGGQEDDTLVGD